MALFSFFTLAETSKKLLGGGKGLVVYLNGDVEKLQGSSGWSYESKEDKSKEHYFRIDEVINSNKLYIEKDNIFIERNDEGKIQRYFEFSKDRGVGKAKYKYKMSSISYEDDYPHSWTMCPDKDECLTVERGFCEELMDVEAAIERGEKGHSDVAKFFSENYDKLASEQKKTMKYAAMNLPIDELHSMNPFSKTFDKLKLNNYMSLLKNDNYFIFTPGDLGGDVLSQCQSFVKRFPAKKPSKGIVSEPFKRGAPKSSKGL